VFYDINRAAFKVIGQLTAIERTSHFGWLETHCFSMSVLTPQDHYNLLWALIEQDKTNNITPIDLLELVANYSYVKNQELAWAATEIITAEHACSLKDSFFFEPLENYYERLDNSAQRYKENAADALKNFSLREKWQSNFNACDFSYTGQTLYYNICHDLAGMNTVCHAAKEIICPTLKS
jgi:hypothetical protein